MAARIIDGAAIAERLRARIAAAVARSRARRMCGPGSRSCSSATIRRARSTSAARRARRSRPGCAPSTTRFLPTASEDELLALVHRLNADREVDGILVQLPLPPQIDSRNG